MSSKKDQITRILIQLSSTEKAYFKKFAFKSGVVNNDITFLFDLVDKGIKKEGIEFNIESLRKTFNEKSTADFTKTKSRLLEFVLKSLKDYDTNQSFLSEIFSLLEISDSLAKRNLFYDAYNILQKAKKQAAEIEEPEIELHILHKLEELSSYIHKYEKTNLSESINIENSFQKINFLIDKYECDRATFKVLQFQKIYGIPKNESEQIIFKSLVNNKYFNGEKTTQFYSSELSRIIAQNGLLFMQGKVDKVVEISKNAIENLPKNKKLITKLSGRILSVYDSFLQALLLSFQFDLFNEYYPKFLEVKTNTIKELMLKTSIDLFVSSLYAVLTDKQIKLKTVSDQFLNIEKEDYIPNYRKISIAYYLLFGFFLFGDYSNAQNYVIWLRNHSHYGIRDDIESTYLIIELILLWKNNDLDLLTYKLRNYKEYITKKDKKIQIEESFYKLIKELTSTIDIKTQTNIFNKHINLIKQSIKKDNSSQMLNNTFDIMTWIQSELENKSFKKLYYINNGIIK